MGTGGLRAGQCSLNTRLQTCPGHGWDKHELGIKAEVGFLGETALKRDFMAWPSLYCLMPKVLQLFSINLFYLKERSRRSVSSLGEMLHHLGKKRDKFHFACNRSWKRVSSQRKITLKILLLIV